MAKGSNIYGAIVAIKKKRKFNEPQPSDLLSWIVVTTASTKSLIYVLLKKRGVQRDFL